jgi:SHS2 domain-containing protein
MKYEFFDVTADVGYKAYGETLEESFENAALALFEVITDTAKVKCMLEREISIESEDLFALLFDWLSELIFLHDSEFLVFSRFKVKIVKSKENYRLNAVVCGEAFDLMIHESREDVKAATYHLMDIKEENGYILQVILDT